MCTPDISLAYKLALEIDRLRGGGILDDEDVGEEVETSNLEYESDIKEFNRIADLLNKALLSGDMEQQDKELVRLKVYTHNLVTIFSNLNDELEKIVKAYAYLEKRNKL